MTRPCLLLTSMMIFACTTPESSDPIVDPDPVPPAPACPDSVELSGEITAPVDIALPDTITVALLQMDFGDGPPPLDQVLVSTTVEGLAPGGSATWLVCLPYTPEDAWFSEEDDDASIAAFVVGAWHDRIRDGVPTSHETLIGANHELVAYVLNADDEQFAAAGGDVGWNIVGMDLTGEGEGPAWAKPFDEAYTEHDVPANLAPHSYPGLDVVVGPATDTQVMVGLYAMHETFDETPPKDSTLAATAVQAAGDTELTLIGFDNAPPDWHLMNNVSGTEGLLSISLYAGVAFHDNNDNRQLDQTERNALVAASFAEDQQTAVLYVKPRHLLAGMLMQQHGAIPGWSVVDMQTDGWPRHLPWADGLHLVGPDQD